MRKSECIKKHNISFAFSVLFLSLILSGCGAKNAEETMISVDKEGVITSVIYDEFNQDYYKLNELEDMATSEISYYNSEYSTPKITLKDTELTDDGKVLMSMEYQSFIDYSHFNQVTFYYGTVHDAVEKGFTISNDLADKDGTKLSKDELSDMSDRHIIITSEKNKIVAPYSIAYTTKSVVVRDKKEADLTLATDNEVQLLLSK